MFGFFKQKKTVKKIDKRKKQRRSGQPRREEFRWDEGDKQDRRTNPDRRKSNNTWDQTKAK